MVIMMVNMIVKVTMMTITMIMMIMMTIMMMLMIMMTVLEYACIEDLFIGVLLCFCWIP